MSEISTLIIESTAVSITSSLIAELSKHRINVIFCNNKHDPEAQLVPFYGCHNSSTKINEQLSWDNEIKDLVWQEVVKNKIHSQMLNLETYGHEQSLMLKEYKSNVRLGDTTNREGHAAKVYFNALFGNDFARSKDVLENMYLNYGYAILLSNVNRFVVSSGYLTQIGIHHKNEYNSYNFSCDLMEPFRPIIDAYAVSGLLTQDNFKKHLSNLDAIKVRIKKQKTNLENAIKIYCSSVFKALNTKDASCIEMYDSYEF